MQQRWLALALGALMLGGCAFQNPKNTPILTTLDKHVQPESTGAKIGYGLFWVPAGVVCGLTDVFIAHPIQATGPAARATVDAMWNTKGQSFIQQTILFVPRVAFTPVVFVATWLFESAFDVPHPEKSPAPEQELSS
jgi:hypothetical protein